MPPSGKNWTRKFVTAIVSSHHRSKSRRFSLVRVYCPTTPICLLCWAPNLETTCELFEYSDSWCHCSEFYSEILLTKSNSANEREVSGISYIKPLFKIGQTLKNFSQKVPTIDIKVVNFFSTTILSLWQHLLWKIII